ncbi:SOS response-associated peptidase [Jannaschia aquimarina]|uniref:Abasic site processing protein n=1 Tax=Jannaschia aquimarina TaxID=935700 RepID=A0A0D1D852_9RHOB|nr:SOS response-associated peptidase [Jannaschia aquimarina]KIT16118.1 putative SOS response-associated peptidase YedK [Jannaschia aquimarina]SNT37465.1 Putative SOS response-associated peptidase YedK [Jannaschia aquimarina]
MCGRYALTLPHEATATLFAAAPGNDLPEVPRWNVCPTTQIVAVLPGRRLVSMRWGFIPHWYDRPAGGPLLINARSETVATKPAFRDAIRSRRCLIPATGFYEWTKDADGNRLPWYFHRPDGASIAFAGLWQEWRDLGPTCAIVSTAAGPTMAQIHHREPVMLPEEDWATWLGETDEKAAPLMRPVPDRWLERHRVSTKVNSNRAEGPDLIDPLIEDE